jgi:co-chaperonin GroES (HSP10)
MAEALAEVSTVSVEDDTATDTRAAHQMPDPKGYKLLIGLPEPEKASQGGILKAQETIAVEEVGSIVGFVIKLGPDAYTDKSRFPNGPYCKEGDFVIMRSYSGTRFKVHGKEFRLINDDSVEAVVEDPRGVMKV